MRTSHVHAGGAQHRPGDAQIQHVFERNEADALGAADPDRIVRQQVFVFVDLLGKTSMNLLTRFVPAARRLQRQPADAEVAGHHALAGEHFEDLQDVFALAEAVEEDLIAPISSACVPSQTRWLLRRVQFGQHHAHPLRLRRNLSSMPSSFSTARHSTRLLISCAR